MSEVRHVLIVDADEALCDTLRRQFPATGEFDLVAVASLESACRASRSRSFDAVLLDYAAGIGRDAFRLLRPGTAETPIILLADPSRRNEAMRELAAGADGLLLKPFRLSALLSRLRSVLPRDLRPEARPVRLGSFLLDPTVGRLEASDRTRDPVRLTEKETAILVLLHHRAGHIVTRTALLREIWGYDDQIATRTLDTHIYRLRQKIESDPAHPSLLVSVPGGYRLIT